MIDAYTKTDDIPYLAFPRGRSIISNAVKVVVMHEGSVDFYVADETDPLVQFYRSFRKSLSPCRISRGFAFTYSLSGRFLTFRPYVRNGMNDVTVFYNKEDMSLPTELYSGKERQMESYYLIMKLPEEESAEFVLLLPFVPQGKDNMISWLAARSDGDEYGNLVLYQFPKQKLIYGPRQIESRIDQDPEISKQITLWSQSGSAVVRGNLLVIPIEDSLM